MNSRQDGQNRTSATGREAVARQLAAAASRGRLSSQGLEKRLFLTHDADTYDQFEELVADLPGAQEPVARTVPEHTVPETLDLTASLRNARRDRRWKVPRHIVASAGLG